MGAVDAREMLERALGEGSLVRGCEVNATTCPQAARSYLSDGTALAWTVPLPLRAAGSFVLDAEIPAQVRPSLVRRYGVIDADAFARQWTRAEALAKLHDTPIITWLARHGLDVPTKVQQARDTGRVAWRTQICKSANLEACVITFAASDRTYRSELGDK